MWDAITYRLIAQFAPGPMRCAPPWVWTGHSLFPVAARPTPVPRTPRTYGSCWFSSPAICCRASSACPPRLYGLHWFCRSHCCGCRAACAPQDAGCGLPPAPSLGRTAATPLHRFHCGHALAQFHGSSRRLFLDSGAPLPRFHCVTCLLTCTAPVCTAHAAAPAHPAQFGFPSPLRRMCHFLLGCRITAPLG